MKKCINRRCNAEIDAAFVFCPKCGKNQTEQPQKRRRVKGSGSIFKTNIKKSPWRAFKWLHGCQWYVGSFSTKNEAEQAIKDYIPPFERPCEPDEVLTLEMIYEQWSVSKSFERLSESSKATYRAAWIKLRHLKHRDFLALRTSDYQNVIDYYENPHHEEGTGGRLKFLDADGSVTFKHTDTPKICDGLSTSSLNKIKSLVGKLCAYAMRDDLIDKNYGHLLELPPPDETAATRFTETQLEAIRQGVGLIPYCDYIYILCYLNFRISEFLELAPKDYNVEVTQNGTAIPYLIGGKKTEAGRNRLIPVHPNVQQLVAEAVERAKKLRASTIFCREDGTPINKDYFNKFCFKPAIAALGFDGQGLTPHSCRRTFSTRMSAAGAREEDIIALMGHTDFSVDKKHYINQELATLYAAVQKMA